METIYKFKFKSIWKINWSFKKKSSSIKLQRSIAISGVSNFKFVIYYFYEDLSVILNDIETEVINSFPF
jgi:hypothetical protein